MSIVTRRSFIGAVVVVVAGAAGVTAEFVRHPRRRAKHPGSGSASTSTNPPIPPVAPILADALTRERELLSRLDAAFRATPALRGRLAVLRADHRSHLNALSALVTADGATPTSSASSPTTTPSAAAHPASAAQVLAWEKANAAAAGLDCPSATGSAAAVLASIYACEQTHVAWLA